MGFFRISDKGERFMKGLELAERFFREAAYPLLQAELPECLPHIAAGLGGGSQCHGNDDEISQDHGWGPMIMVWMLTDDYDRFFEPIKNVFTKLPKQFMGYRTEWWALDLDEFMKMQTGCLSPPKSAIGWLHIPEDYLFEVINRPVFYDGPGEAAKRFKAFECYYPEDAWKQRLGACIGWLWSWGVKYHRRAERRGDQITAAYSWSWFATYAMKLGFLLNRRYAPYHKWLYREFCRLPKIAHEVAPLIKAGYSARSKRDRQATKIMDIYVHELNRMGFKAEEMTPEFCASLAYTEGMDLYMLLPSIRKTIQCEEIQNLNPYLEIVMPSSRPTYTWVQP